MDEQSEMEEAAVQTMTTSMINEPECSAPEPCQDYQTARLVLSHLGLLRMYEPKIGAMDGGLTAPAMVPLTTDNVDFINDLEKLDRLSSRTAETVYVFYMKTGQRKPADILNNVTSEDMVNPHFMEFLASLGWPVNVWHHNGWTGRVSTSWRSQNEPMVAPTLTDHGGSIFNGDHHILYWSDAESEIAFIVPSYKQKGWKNSRLLFSNMYLFNFILPLGPDKPELTAESTEGHPKLNRQQSSAGLSDIKVAVVWLENFEDAANFPAEELMLSVAEPNPSFTLRDVVIVFVHVMNNGLLKVQLKGHHGRYLKKSEK